VEAEDETSETGRGAVGRGSALRARLGHRMYDAARQRQPLSVRGFDIARFLAGERLSGVRTKIPPRRDIGGEGENRLDDVQTLRRDQ
jgi:hypothetical protein